MKCLDQLEQRVTELGGSMDRQGLPGFVNLDAPDGKVWGCSFIQSLCVNGASYDETWWVEACKDARERLAYGVCDDPDPELSAHGRGTCDTATCQHCKGCA